MLTRANSKNQMEALFPQPSSVTDPAWYPDSGATNHVTNDLQNINVRGEYGGVGQIVVGNGKGLSIKHIGDSILPCFPHPLCLRNMLHVPAITENLLTVALTYDNNLYFEFHPPPPHFSCEGSGNGETTSVGNP